MKELEALAPVNLGQDLGMIIQYFREVSHILDAGLHNRWHVGTWCYDVMRKVVVFPFGLRM